MAKQEKKEKNKWGGARQKAGRTPIIDKLSNYNKAIKMLDEEIIGNINFLINVREDINQPIQARMKATEIMLNKVMPDKKDLLVKNETDKLTELIDKVSQIV